jgi:hypothetical protein
MPTPEMAGRQVIILKISAIAENDKFQGDHKKSGKCKEQRKIRTDKCKAGSDNDLLIGSKIDLFCGVSWAKIFLVWESDQRRLNLFLYGIQMLEFRKSYILPCSESVTSGFNYNNSSPKRDGHPINKRQRHSQSWVRRRRDITSI